MNDAEFRAVLDWWMCSDPWPSGVDADVIYNLLRREGLGRGYAAPHVAYHEHKADESLSATKSGWIAVTERLPEYTENKNLCVLAYSDTHEWMGARYQVMRQRDFWHFDPDCDELGTDDTRVVTHWMHLPKEPA